MSTRPNIAYEYWLQYGGNEQSKKERINWERGKLRTKLAKRGLGGVKELFVHQTIEGVHEFKLNLDIEQIELIE